MPGKKTNHNKNFSAANAWKARKQASNQTAENKNRQLTYRQTALSAASGATGLTAKQTQEFLRLTT